MTTRGGGRVRGGRAGERGFFRLNEDYKQVVLDMTRPHLEEIAEVGKNLAYASAAKDTGEMADSIQSGTRKLGDRIEAFVVVGSDHWQFVEYGTGQRGALTNDATGIQSQGYSHGESIGQPSRPFMRPALMEMERVWNHGS